MTVSSKSRLPHTQISIPVSHHRMFSWNSCQKCLASMPPFKAPLCRDEHAIKFSIVQFINYRFAIYMKHFTLAIYKSHLCDYISGICDLYLISHTWPYKTHECKICVLQISITMECGLWIARNYFLFFFVFRTLRTIYQFINSQFLQTKIYKLQEHKVK